MRRLKKRYYGLKPVSLYLCLFALLPNTGEVFAFGEEGHRIIATLAADQLSPHARKQVELLLFDEPDPSLPGVSFWADQHKNRYTAPMHYVNMPLGQCSYEPTRDCPKGRCVVEGIKRYRFQLSDVQAKRETRITALKMLVHLVGDAHQPLHAGLEEDRGGNLFQLQWAGKGSNLHRLWDSQLIKAFDDNWITYAKSLRQEKIRVRDSEDPMSWVEQSCSVVNTPGFYPPNRKPGRDYQNQWRPTLERQLQTAGRHLASLLNAAFSVRG